MVVLKKLHSVSDLEELTGIPGTTIRRYISRFPDYFVAVGGSRAKKYEESAIKVLMRIKNLYDNGYETDGVGKVLRDEFPSVVTIGDNDNMESNPPAFATADDINEIKEMLQRQEEFNKLLVEKLDEQSMKVEESRKEKEELKRYIKYTLEKRDKQLTENMNLLIESRKEMAAALEKSEKNKGFWAKLFSK